MRDAAMTTMDRDTDVYADAFDAADDAAPPSTRRLPLGLQAGIVLALLAVIAGVASVLYQPAPGPPGDTSAEAGFARDMSTHHGQAVNMALIIRDRSANTDLRQFAIDIVLTQQAQIGMMSGWLQLWGLRPAGSEPAMTWMGHGSHDGNSRMPGMATPAQLTELQTIPVNEAEILFLQLMIAHHRGGVDMARGLLERSDDDTVRTLAQKIVDGQQYEIEVMEAWLQELQGA